MASATVTVELAVAALPPTSVIITTALKLPSSAKEWLPPTWNMPPDAVIVPCDEVPSPQLMVALKSLTTAPGLFSPKPATKPLKAEPSTVLRVVPWAASEPSDTVAEPVTVAELPPGSFTETVTIRLPSSA